MINLFLESSMPIIAFCGILIAFVMTCLFIFAFSKYLPKDLGRDFAHDGKVSVGKPRGAGFIFIFVFVVVAVIFSKLSRENLIYLILITAAMITGFLDDTSRSPWGEYKKGFLDLIIAVMTAVTVLNAGSNTIELMSVGKSITIPPIVFGILAVILVWTSINVTNCSDGVDGLSGTITIITIMSIYVIDNIKGINSGFEYLILVFAVCILGYLWYNATPSRLLMGDAGSRAMGLFISIAILKTGSPFLYIPVAFVLLVDGGLGLIKVFLLRFLKIHILKNTRTPLHDHVRKVMGWSNTQTVFRFAIIQIVISIGTIYMVMVHVK